jgi:hypothetical protein
MEVRMKKFNDSIGEYELLGPGQDDSMIESFPLMLLVATTIVGSLLITFVLPLAKEFAGYFVG